MNGPTNAGGGVTAKGFIQTTYPEGFICICSNGTRTLKARDPSGNMMFILPAIGKWTVTATDPADPTNTDSETVEIIKEGETVSVELSCGTYLFNRGAKVEWLTWQEPNAEISIGDTIKIATKTGSYYHYCSAYTAEKIDVTDYSSLIVRGEFDYIPDMEEYGTFFGLTSDTPTYITVADSAVAAITPTTGEKSWSVDLSAIRGEYYCSLLFAGDEDSGVVGDVTIVLID